MVKFKWILTYKLAKGLLNLIKKPVQDGLVLTPTRLSYESWLFLLLFLLILLFYCVSLPKFMPDADGPEFVVIGMFGGIAHPPGYPLYSILLRMFDLIRPSFVEPVTFFAGISVLFVGLSVLVNHLSLSALKIKPISSVLALGLCYLSVSVWLDANNVEPFALNLLLVSLVIYISLRIFICLNRNFETEHSVNRAYSEFSEPRREDLKKRSLLQVNEHFSTTSNAESGDSKQALNILYLGVIYGLGFCNHHTLAFLAPMSFVVLFFVYKNGISLVRITSHFLSGFVLGLLPLLYFYFANLNAPMVWGGVEWADKPFSRLVTHLFRVEYGTFRLAADVAKKMDISDFLSIMLDDFYYVGFFAGAFGIFVLLKNAFLSFINQSKVNPNENQVLMKYLLVLLIALIVSYGFFSFVIIDESPFFQTIIRRFFAMPATIWMFYVAFGLHLIERRLPLKCLLMSKILVFFLLIFVGIFHLDSSDRRSRSMSEIAVTNMLDIASNGTLITNSDLLWAGIPYIQYVKGLSKDVKYFVDSLNDVSWSNIQNLNRLAIPDSSRGSRSDTLQFLMESGPVYAQRSCYSINVSRYSKLNYPLGPLLKLVPSQSMLPSPEKIFELNQRFYRELVKGYPFSHPENLKEWDRSILEYYQHTWIDLENAFKDKNSAIAQSCGEFKNWFAAVMPSKS